MEFDRSRPGAPPSGLENAQRVRGAVALLGSGAAAAVGLVALARGWFPGVSVSIAATLILFIQWETLSLTCAKWGLDQLVFARLSSVDIASTPDISHHIRTRAVPIAVAVVILLVPVFGVLPSVMLGFATVLDASATVRMSALAAQGRFRDISIANMLNYPLFFGLLVIVSAVANTDLTLAAGCFALSSSARLAWVNRVEGQSAGIVRIPMRAPFGLGAQQALNLVLFRGDQLALPLVSASLFGVTIGTGLTSYVYLARFPELVSSVLVTIGPVILPPLYARLRHAGPDERANVGLMFVASWALAIGAAFVFSYFGSAPVRPLWVAAFGTAAALALPANLLTYALLREERLPQLLRALAYAAFIGGGVLLVAVLAHTPLMFAMSVPAALAAYVLFALAPRERA